MALQQFTILDPSGMPIGTQVCEGESCYPALQAGQSRVADVQGMNPAAFTTTIDPSGKRIPPPSVARDFQLPAFTPEPTSARGIPGGRAALSSTPDLPQGLDVSVPTMQTAQPPATSAAPLTPRSAPPPSFGRSGGYAPTPTYADGTQHPLQGGPQRVPGGQAAQQGGSSYRENVYNPDTGAWAGPSGASAARPADNIMYGGGTFSGGGGGGGGGGSLAQDLYHQIKGNVESRLSGIMGGGGESGYPSDASYRRQGRRTDRAYEKYNDALYNPDPQKARGWAKDALGKNRGTYPAMLMDPIHVATEGMGLDPMAEGGTFDFLESVPAGDLAFILGGTGNNDMTRRTKPVKVPGILRQQGVKPTKPENPRELDYSKYASEVRDLYSSMTDSTDQNVLDSGFLMGNLADAKKSGALRMGIDTQADYDPGGAFDRAKGYIDSAFAGRSDLDRDTYARMAAKYFAEEPVLSKKPKRISGTVNAVANRFLNQQVS